jgi:FMN phosphatase YigB (HAD superfamily)
MIVPNRSAVDPEQLELWKTDICLRKVIPVGSSIKMISLDIFDTLLFRSCSRPTDVFVAAAEKAVTAGILRSTIRPYAFRDIRIKAELQARSRLAGIGQSEAGMYAEVTLEHIYAEIPDSVCDRERMLDVELETEREVCYLNPHVASLVNWCHENGISVALLSDMYMSTEQLSGILQSAGLDLSRIDALLISNEQQCGKVSGRLFDCLLARFPHLTNLDVWHIGDNVTADVVGAASRHIQAIHYNVIPEHFDNPFHWDTIRHAGMLPQLTSIRKLAGLSMADEADEDERFFYRFGAGVLGPFLHGWCEWVIDECIRENRTEVHPLMREAYLLAPMLEKAAQMRGIELVVKPLYISRQATYLASLEKFDEEAMNRLLELNWVTAGDLFAMLDIGEQSADFQRYLQTPIAECSLIPDQSGRTTITGLLREFMLSEPIQQKTREAIAKNRKLFVDYIWQEIGSPERLVTVDIGFNGTIQKAIETALRLSELPHQMIHILAVGTDKVGTLLLQGMDIRCFLGSGGENSDLGQRIARSPAFLEELMMGPFGSTLRYEMDPHGVIKPVLAQLPSHTDEELRRKKACQEGVFAFVRYYEYLRKAKPEPQATWTIDSREWSKPLHRAIEMPTPEEACLLGNLTHQENFCGMQTSPVCNPVADRWFDQGEEAFIDFCNYGPSTFNAFWPQGMATRKSPYYLYRYYLRQQDGFGSASLIFDLLQRVKQDEISTVHLYGSGAIAEAVRNAVLFHKLKIVCFFAAHADSNALIEAAGEADTHTYIVAALHNILAHKREIELAYSNSGISPVIYDLSARQ